MNKNVKMDIPTAEQLKNELDRRRYKHSYIRSLLSTFGTLLVAAAAVVLISQFAFPVLRVTGSSMHPALSEDQIILCSRYAHVQKGDIIAFYHNKKILVKRVIACGGDIIDISENGTVTLNGAVLDEPYASFSGEGECDINFPYTVPDSRYFVMGDDRKVSVDSRSSAVGCVASENVIGRVSTVLLPVESFGRL